MRRLGTFGWIMVTACLGWMTQQDVIAERSMSRSRLEKELEHLRHSLHEAHRELGMKADRIAKLEAELAKSSGKTGETVSRMTEPPVEKTEIAVQASTETTCREELKQVSENRVTDPGSAEQTAERIAERIYYEQNSAVNYEGREKLLEFVRQELKQFPRARFIVEATANDSAFEATDHDIASNRARFLVDYLKIRGVPEKVFSGVVSESTEKKGRNGRMTQITAVRNP